MSEIQPAHYDLTLVRLRPRTVPAALERMQTWLKREHGGGDLLGCLFSELGIVNQVLLLRRFGGIHALLNARQRIVHSTDPLGVGEFAVELVMNIGVAMPATVSTPAASKGPVFEVRTDVPRPGSMDRAFSLWRDVCNRAGGPRPSFGAYSIAGDSASLVHIWPWATLDERVKVADDASPANIWRRADPGDAPLSQRCDIFRAAAFSPMQ